MKLKSKITKKTSIIAISSSVVLLTTLVLCVSLLKGKDDESLKNEVTSSIDSKTKERVALKSEEKDPVNVIVNDEIKEKNDDSETKREQDSSSENKVEKSATETRIEESGKKEENNVSSDDQKSIEPMNDQGGKKDEEKEAEETEESNSEPNKAVNAPNNTTTQDEEVPKTSNIDEGEFNDGMSREQYELLLKSNRKDPHDAINSYPWRDDCPDNQDSYVTYWQDSKAGWVKLGGLVCENVSYVAWKAYEKYGVALSFGNAYMWSNEARAHGYVVDNKPAPNTIGQVSNGTWGQVFWVEGINPDGSIYVTAYNDAWATKLYSGDQHYGDFGAKTIEVSEIHQYNFIHFSN